MFLELDPASILLAFAITLVEMTEVVALVFAFGSDGATVRPAAYGAILGVAVVAGFALVAGVALAAVPTSTLLWGASATLFLFGLFLLRSTLRTYRKLRDGATGKGLASASLPFTGGFAAGGVETVETVIVLLALAAGGHGGSALVGTLAGGTLLIVVALLVHERVRRIKVPTLKLGATSALFSFAVFWGSEAAGLAWPGPRSFWDLYLVPLFALFWVLLGGAIRWRVATERPVGAKG